MKEMKQMVILLLVGSFLVSCDWGIDGNNSAENNKPTIIQKPCKENDDTNLKYNKLVDNLVRNFNFEQKSFDEIKQSIKIVKEIKTIQKDSDCLIKQNAKLESIKKSCIEMKLSSQELFTKTKDKDFQERISFYTEMIKLLNE